MATKKQNKDFKSLSKEELAQAIAKAERTLFDARFKKSTGTLENGASVWKTRKLIARLKGEFTASAMSASSGKKVG